MSKTLKQEARADEARRQRAVRARVATATKPEPPPAPISPVETVEPSAPPVALLEHPQPEPLPIITVPETAPALREPVGEVVRAPHRRFVGTMTVGGVALLMTMVYFSIRQQRTQLLVVPRVVASVAEQPAPRADVVGVPSDALTVASQPTPVDATAQPGPALASFVVDDGFPRAPFRANAPIVSGPVMLPARLAAAAGLSAGTSWSIGERFPRAPRIATIADSPAAASHAPIVAQPVVQVLPEPPAFSAPARIAPATTWFAGPAFLRAPRRVDAAGNQPAPRARTSPAMVALTSAMTSWFHDSGFLRPPSWRGDATGRQPWSMELAVERRAAHKARVRFSTPSRALGSVTWFPGPVFPPVPRRVDVPGRDRAAHSPSSTTALIELTGAMTSWSFESGFPRSPLRADVPANVKDAWPARRARVPAFHSPQRPSGASGTPATPAPSLPVSGTPASMEPLASGAPAADSINPAPISSKTTGASSISEHPIVPEPFSNPPKSLRRYRQMETAEHDPDDLSDAKRSPAPLFRPAKL